MEGLTDTQHIHTLNSIVQSLLFNGDSLMWERMEGDLGLENSYSQNENGTQSLKREIAPISKIHFL